MSDDLKPIGEAISTLFGEAAPAAIKKRPTRRLPAGITPIKQRLIDTAVAAATSTDPQEILFQHTIFCQTGMPYRDPGASIRDWKRSNGIAALHMQAGSIIDPASASFVDVGLPFGPKPRLILCHINTEALQTGKSQIDTERTLTRFVSHGLGLDTNGRTIRSIKDQLTRLSTCTIRLGMTHDGRGDQINAQIVASFSVWLEKDSRQRVLWPSTIDLDPKYFESLQAHAVPLDYTHLAALSHSAMALDVYAWLAQRIHRVQPNRAAFIPWVSLHQQFGADYTRIRAFRSAFKVALKQVHTVYRQARIGLDGGGLTLWHSEPPVRRRLFPTRLGKPVEDER